MSDILWRRLRYMLSPQWDIYKHLAEKVSGKDVLDIGCGTGFGTLQLSRYAKHVDGVDVDPDAVRFAQASFPRITFSYDDITQGETDAGYEVAVMVEVLEHIEDYDKALENVHHLLLPGGELYITARNANADLRRNDLHLREWTAQEFAEALAVHFESVELYDYSLTKKQDLTTRVTPLVAVARKKNPEPSLEEKQLNGARSPY